MTTPREVLAAAAGLAAGAAIVALSAVAGEHAPAIAAAAVGLVGLVAAVVVADVLERRAKDRARPRRDASVYRLAPAAAPDPVDVLDEPDPRLELTVCVLLGVPLAGALTGAWTETLCIAGLVVVVVHAAWLVRGRQ